MPLDALFASAADPTAITPPDESAASSTARRAPRRPLPRRAGAAAEPAPRRSGSSLGRAFDVLGLFSTATPLLRMEDVMRRLGYSRSTAYRYVKEMCDAGLLTPGLGGRYSLGPRIVELERLLELTDPLYRAGRSVLPALRRENSVLLLQDLYRGDQVMCIYKEGPDVLEHDGQRVSIQRARGLPFPLFRGAASLALLAWMTPHRMKQIYLAGAADIARAGLGERWDDFRRALAAIRRLGHAVSRGQLSPSPRIVGVAVPVLLADEKRLIGSLAEVFPCAELSEEAEHACAARLHMAARGIADAYRLASRDDEAALA